MIRRRPVVPASAEAVLGAEAALDAEAAGLKCLMRLPALPTTVTKPSLPLAAAAAALSSVPVMLPSDSAVAALERLRGALVSVPVPAAASVPAAAAASLSSGMAPAYKPSPFV